MDISFEEGGGQKTSVNRGSWLTRPADDAEIDTANRQQRQSYGKWGVNAGGNIFGREKGRVWTRPTNRRIGPG